MIAADFAKLQITCTKKSNKYLYRSTLGDELT